VEVEFSASDPIRGDMLVAMQAQLRRVGVDMLPRSYERTTWVERLRGREFTGSFWGWGWGPGVMGPNAEMLFHSRSIPPNGPNFAGYRNPRVDALIDSILVMNDSTRARGPLALAGAAGDRRRRVRAHLFGPRSSTPSTTGSRTSSSAAPSGGRT
jgi:hypothetical protein